MVKRSGTALQHSVLSTQMLVGQAIGFHRVSWVSHSSWCIVRGPDGQEFYLEGAERCANGVRISHSQAEE